MRRITWIAILDWSSVFVTFAVRLLHWWAIPVCVGTSFLLYWLLLEPDPAFEMTEPEMPDNTIRATSGDGPSLMVDCEILRERILDYPHGSYMFVYGLMKNIALAAAAYVLPQILVATDDTKLLRLMFLAASSCAVVLTHSTAACGLGSPTTSSTPRRCSRLASPSF